MLSSFVVALGKKGLFFCDLGGASHLGPTPLCGTVVEHHTTATGDPGSIPGPDRIIQPLHGPSRVFR